MELVDGETAVESGIGDSQKQRQIDVSRSTQFEVKQRFMPGKEVNIPFTVVIWRSLVKFAGMFPGKKAKGQVALAKGEGAGDPQVPH